MIRHVCVAAALLAAVPAARGEEDACTAEVARLCPRSRGDILLMGCLSANEREISKACKGDLEAVLAKVRSIALACEGDVQRLCKDVEPGDGRVAHCLKLKEHELSQGCQGAFNTWRLMRMELTAACAGDVGRFCRDVPEGGGRIWTCLKARLPRLTSECRDAVKKL
jgi:Golgi apparatus protein 1